MTETRNELVIAAQSGDRAAFGRLTLLLEPAVYADLRVRLGNDADVRDVMQEVFMQAMRKIHQLRDPKAVKAWLMRMARNLAINHATRRRTVDVPDSIQFAAAELPQPGLDLFGVNERMLEKALANLSPPLRDVLVGHYLQGKLVKVLAVEMRRPEGTIKRWLREARTALRTELEGQLSVMPKE